MNTLKNFWKKGCLAKLVVLMVGFFLFSCLCSVPIVIVNPDFGEDINDGGLADKSPLSNTSTPTPSWMSRCENVPAGRVNDIEWGLIQDQDKEIHLRGAQAVRSKDYEKVYFVAADLEGEGMEGGGPIGVWITNDLKPSEKSGAGIILSVNEVANANSDWGDGRNTKAEFTMDKDGAETAVKCTKAILEDIKSDIGTVPTLTQKPTDTPKPTTTPKPTPTKDTRSKFQKCADADYGISYVITGSNVTGVSITLQNDMGGTEQGDYRLPYCNHMVNFSHGDFLYISAQILGGSGSIECRIVQEGVVLSKAKASGFPNIATCRTIAR